MRTRTARRTHGFTESVIRGMTRLANEHGAINLSQGFPNFPCPDVLKDAAARAIRDDVNQYAITWGAARLRNALAAKYQDWYGMAADPMTQVTVTCGATEAMVSALLGIVNPGDEVVVFEPFYENYGPDAILCDAKPVFVPMPAEGRIDLDRLARRSRRRRAPSSSARPTIPRAGCSRAWSSPQSPSSASGTTRSPSRTRSTNTSTMRASTSLSRRCREWRI